MRFVKNAYVFKEIIRSSLNNDKQRLNYLKEQSTIARELNIIDNQIDNVNLTQSSVSLSINTADIAYYLRGYKAIDKEIDIQIAFDALKAMDVKIDKLTPEQVKYANN